MQDTCLIFDDLTLGYDGHPAVHHLNGRVARGSLTAVVGANGSGKSTLMKAVAGVLSPISGSCRRADALSIAYLPQQSELDRSFPARVTDLVALGLWPRRGLLGRWSIEDKARLSQALLAVGLAGFEKRALDQLSGGQMQRVLFARALCQDADLILLDEPFNAVDERTVDDLLAIIRHWIGEGRTVMAVLHDHDLVRGHFPQTLLLAREAIAWGRTEDVLVPAMLAKARQFQEAWDDKAPWCLPTADDGVPSGMQAVDRARVALHV
ncbi:MAG: zinc ABC transporter ATP-binding protein AztA [Allorhizobium sp.]